MSYGIIEIISLLLGLAGFGLHANPKAPTADQALEYAMPDPDVTIHVDVTSVVEGNYKTLKSLPDQPQIKSSPDLAKAVRQVIDQVEGARGLIQGQTGIDLATDIADATVYGQFVAGQKDPIAIASVHGNFTTAQLDKIATAMHAKTTKVGSGAYVEMDGNALAVTKDRVLLAGTASLVKDRLQDSWKTPAHGSGTTLGSIGALIDGKPVFAVALTLSTAARKRVMDELGSSSQNFATDVIQRHKLAAFAIYHDGIGWQWTDSSKSGLDAMATLSDGMIDLLRAAQIAPRGFAKVVLGGLESYRGADKRVDEVLKHKDDVMKIVESFTGDGSFQKKIDKDPSKLTLSVRLTGKTLSEVLPVGVLVPFAGLGLFVMGRAAPASSLQGYPQPTPTPVHR